MSEPEARGPEDHEKSALAPSWVSTSVQVRQTSTRQNHGVKLLAAFVIIALP
jgi:hypothetical protein